MGSGCRGGCISSGCAMALADSSPVGAVPQGGDSAAGRDKKSGLNRRGGKLGGTAWSAKLPQVERCQATAPAGRGGRGRHLRLGCRGHGLHFGADGMEDV